MPRERKGNELEIARVLASADRGEMSKAQALSEIRSLVRQISAFERSGEFGQALLVQGQQVYERELSTAPIDTTTALTPADYENAARLAMMHVIGAALENQ